MTMTMTYEQVTFEQLPNRAPNVDRFMGNPVTPEQAYVVMTEVKGVWEVDYEVELAQQAESIANRLRNFNKLNAKVVYAVRTQSLAVSVSPVSRKEAEPVTQPTQAQLQAAIRQSIYGDNAHGMHIAVSNVNQFLPRDCDYPRRYHLVIEDEIKSLYPTSKYVGGGVFELK